MKFKNLDWELEARLVARAFGVDKKCDWLVSAGERVLRFEGKHFVFLRDDLVQTLSYSSRSRDFIFKGNVRCVISARTSTSRTLLSSCLH